MSIERERYLDLTKGAAILLMLLAHTMSGTGFLRTYISSFHMQIFFVVCGILLQMRYGSETISWLRLRLHFCKRLYQLGIPYLVFSAVLTLFYCLLEVLSGSVVHLHERLIRIITLQGIDSLWFLPVFFFAELLMMLVMHFKEADFLPIALTIGAVVMVGVLPYLNVECIFLRLLIKVLVGFAFIQLGRLLKRLQLCEKFRAPVAVFMLLIGASLSHLNGFAAMGSLELGHFWPLFFFNASVTSTAIVSLLFFVDRAGYMGAGMMKFVTLFGEYSIVALCTNNLLIEIVRLFDHVMTGSILIRLGVLGSILLWIGLVLIEVPIIFLARGKLGILWGRKLQVR